MKESTETVSIKLPLFCPCAKHPKYMSIHKGEILTEIQFYTYVLNLPRMQRTALRGDPCFSSNSVLYLPRLKKSSVTHSLVTEH